jgi:cytochrome b involved in lipid metabolism
MDDVLFHQILTGLGRITPPFFCRGSAYSSICEANIERKLPSSTYFRYAVMVYLALGILAVSVTFYVYSSGRPQWLRRGGGLSLDQTLKTQPVDADRKGSGQEDAFASSKKPEKQSNGVKHVLLKAQEGQRGSPQTSPQTTPKAGSQHGPNGGIPSLTLDGMIEEEFPNSLSQPEDKPSYNQTLLRKDPTTVRQGQPSPAPQLSMLRPPQPTPTAPRKSTPSSSNLMPPPSRPRAITNRAPPKPSSTLLPPPSAASSLRVPLSRSLAPTTSSLPPSSRPSKKVLLAPGHSPLDWAHLVNNPPTSTFLRGASVPPSLIRVPPSLLKYHNGRKGKDGWGVWQGKVYNMTPYMDFHPGGVDQLMRGAGKEGAEKLFLEVHPWVSWEAMLGECLIGILVGEEEVKADRGMDDMD